MLTHIRYFDSILLVGIRLFVADHGVPVSESIGNKEWVSPAHEFLNSLRLKTRVIRPLYDLSDFWDSSIVPRKEEAGAFVFGPIS